MEPYRGHVCRHSRPRAVTEWQVGGRGGAPLDTRVRIIKRMQMALGGLALKGLGEGAARDRGPRYRGGSKGVVVGGRQTRPTVSSQPVVERVESLIVKKSLNVQKDGRCDLRKTLVISKSQMHVKLRAALIGSGCWLPAVLSRPSYCILMSADPSRGPAREDKIAIHIENSNCFQSHQYRPAEQWAPLTGHMLICLHQ